MIEFSSTFLSTFKTIPNSCVFAIISDSSMKCFISHSSNLKARIGGLIDSFGDDYRLVVLEEIEDLEYKLLLCEKYKQKYMNDGYEVISSKQYINYRVGIRYGKRFHEALVVLYNKRGDKKVVGVFSSITDAKEFVDRYYKGQELVVPVYSTNKETREYVEKERKMYYKKNGRIQN